MLLPMRLRVVLHLITSNSLASGLRPDPYRNGSCVVRGELALLRAQANRPQKASTRSRAPFVLTDDDDVVLSN
jgi:hypothetical protein